MSVTILIGDMRARLRELPDGSIDSCVTDPPYHLTSIVKRFGAENAAPVKVGKTGAYARASKGFMGQTWDGGDVAFQPETWIEVYRVLKPGAHLIAFSGARTFGRMQVAIEEAGFEVRDSILNIIASDDPIRLFLDSLSDEQQRAFLKCIEESQFGGLLAWIYGSGFPKSHDVAKGIDKVLGTVGETVATGDPVKRMIPGAQQEKSGWEKNDGREFVPHDYVPGSPEAAEWQGWGTALKPALEPIVLARKPLVGTVARNVLQHGCGALNIDGCRIEAPEGAIVRMAHSETGASRGYDGGIKGGHRVEPHTEGRWPANVVHDGSDEVISAFPVTASGADRDGNRGSALGVESRPAGTEMVSYGDEGSAARFFYSAKASKADRGEDNPHPTVKPLGLMRWLCRLVTPKGGTVLDPFAGSGSTLIAADAEQFHAIGCELSAEYAAVAERRVRDAAGMFAEVQAA